MCCLPANIYGMTTIDTANVAFGGYAYPFKVFDADEDFLSLVDQLRLALSGISRGSRYRSQFPAVTGESRHKQRR